ncbi:hypothetical protein BH11PSE11_BH11PSE11_14440 [soil metagenome]
MKSHKFTIALLLAALAGAGAYGVFRLGVQSGARQGMAATSPAMPFPIPSVAPLEPATGKQAAGKTVLYWHDPMVPGQKFDKPGKSPFMDMQLVPMYAEDSGGGKDAGGVSIDPRIQQNLGIRTAEVSSGRLASGIEAVGSIAYNEREVALVQARANGFLERLYVRAPLDPVRKGQPLADLTIPDWVAAQEEFLTVRRLGTNAPDGLLDGARQRMRLVGMSDEQIKLVESGGKVRSRISINAPIAGIVTELSAREGMTVASGAPLFRINGTATVWVNAEIPESLAAQVRPGMKVEARTAAFPEQVFHGKVGAILPDVSAATRTLKARIELANPGARLVPGMFARVNFSSSDKGDVLLIPSEAVIQTAKRNVVMVVQGEGKFMPVEIETGAEANGRIEVRKGLAAGQKVVVSGQFLVDSEASLKGVEARFNLDSKAASMPESKPESKPERHPDSRPNPPAVRGAESREPAK